MSKFYHSLGEQDQLSPLIQKINVTQQNQKLLISVQTPDQQIYQGELSAEESEKEGMPLDEIKMYLEGKECHSVVQDKETLKFICYDVPLILKNADALMIIKARSRKDELEKQIQQLKILLELKIKELKELDLQIHELEIQFKYKKELKVYQLKIDEREGLGIKGENKLIELVKSNFSFPNLQAVDLVGNQITDAGLTALAENGHKFPNLQTLNLENNQITSQTKNKILSQFKLTFRIIE